MAVIGKCAARGAKSRHIKHTRKSRYCEILNFRLLDGREPRRARSASPGLINAQQMMLDRDATNGPNGHETADSAAQYIATITHELAQIARRNGLDTLGYILDMAQLEADPVSKE
ncbi:MAG: hypothetical protein WBE99_12085 [Xanthobacteraceae bacterium]